MSEEDPNEVSAATAQTLTVISGAMAGGLTLMAGLVAYSYGGSTGRTPTPDQLRTINLLTTVAMAGAAGAIFASELLWRRVLLATKGPLSARVQTAFIPRMACREGAGLLGMTVAYVAALNGALRLYPAYWANLVPYALFLGFLATHWPSAARLTADAREVLGPDRVLDP